MPQIPVVSVNMGGIETNPGFKLTVDAVDWPALAGRYRAVLDTTGKNLRSLRRAVAPGGRLITISPAGIPASLLTRILPGPSVSFMSVRPSREGLEALKDLVERGRLTLIIREWFSLSRIARTHALVETGHGQGKVVIDIN